MHTIGNNGQKVQNKCQIKWKELKTKKGIMTKIGSASIFRIKLITSYFELLAEENHQFLLYCHSVSFCLCLFPLKHKKKHTSDEDKSDVISSKYFHMSFTLLKNKYFVYPLCTFFRGYILQRRYCMIANCLNCYDWLKFYKYM